MAGEWAAGLKRVAGEPDSQSSFSVRLGRWASVYSEKDEGLHHPKERRCSMFHGLNRFPTSVFDRQEPEGKKGRTRWR
ncbi:hypothetical protein AOLI_G00201110 [Acnodon oligacanthus]